MNRKMNQKRKLLLSLFAVAAIAFVGSEPLQGQTEFSGLPEAGAPVFNADAAAFRTDDGNLRIEVYYKIRNPSLSYRKRQSMFVATYELSVVLNDEKGRQVTGTSIQEDYALETFEMTRRATGYLINQLDLVAPPAKYRLEIMLSDQNSHRMHSEQFDIDLSAFKGGQRVIGGPEFLELVDGDPGDRFRKGEFVTVPRVARRFGGYDDNLYFYAEIYSPDSESEDCALEVNLFQRQKRQHKVDTVMLTSTDKGYCGGTASVSLEGFVQGEVELTFQALREGKPVGMAVQNTIAVEWSIESLIHNDWGIAVEQLVHIATGREMDSLRHTPEVQREQAFVDFWKSRDPTPETVENEWRDEYYRRLAFADRNYSSPYRRGWKTDMGMVYIKYGEPDLVERFPFEMGTKPYQIWHYYEQRRRFTFVDDLGNGEFQLLYPYDGDLTQQQ